MVSDGISLEKRYFDYCNLATDNIKKYFHLGGCIVLIGVIYGIWFLISLGVLIIINLFLFELIRIRTLMNHVWIREPELKFIKKIKG